MTDERELEGRDRLVITPEMEKAGERVLLESGRVIGTLSSDHLLVGDIYRAMVWELNLNARREIGK